MSVWLFTLVLAGLIGLAIKQILDRSQSEYRISVVEMVIGLIAIAVVIAPATNHFGTQMARSNIVRYNEFYNGYELHVVDKPVPCEEDGNCHNNYNCDSYKVVDRAAYTDKDGYHAEQSHMEDRHCPYATEEHDYTVKTTLGDFFIETTFSDAPVAWRPRDHKGFPGNVRRGIPPFWQAAADRIAAGTPGPVTKAKQPYNNYILASSTTILHKYSNSIQRYRKQQLLPPPVANPSNPIHDFYYADKLAFVGNGGIQHPADEAQWQFALSQFDAALGQDLHGDMHMVIVDASLITNPDDYTGAINAYWQSAAFGKDALSKNGIGVVIGASSGRVQWARAFTGMPVGNNGMLQQIRDLQGLQLDPNIILGNPLGKIQGDKVGITNGNGALEQIVWGPNKFFRISMSCHSKGDNCIGYTYLKGEIQATAAQKALMIFVGVLVSCLIWALFIFTFIGEVVRTPARFINSRTYGYYRQERES